MMLLWFSLLQVVLGDSKQNTGAPPLKNEHELVFFAIPSKDNASCCIGIPCFVTFVLCNYGKKPIKIRPLLFPQHQQLGIRVTSPEEDELLFIGPDYYPNYTSAPPALIERNTCLLNEFELTSIFDMQSTGTYRIEGTFFDGNKLLQEPERYRVFSNTCSREMMRCDSRAAAMVDGPILPPRRRGRMSVCNNGFESWGARIPVPSAQCLRLPLDRIPPCLCIFSFPDDS